MGETAAKAVKELLPESAEGDLSSLCLWADRVKFRYHWSPPLHYINTPDACSYQYNSELFHNTSFAYNISEKIPTTVSYGPFVFWWSKGDCKDENGEKGRCVAGAIYSYTTQLLTHNTAAASQSQCSTNTNYFIFNLPLMFPFLICFSCCQTT